ncbi:MAG: hypothetical protein HKO59_17540 [Phycisphaerales bacterium]|nr:hypothetical protein [Phycisphaerae bacterium]NNF42944.1 hypothetical protein [Phycisphaerales bacterium]NNM27746.1 hypothetical protein [Phycisphaerales bacterium]
MSEPPRAITLRALSGEPLADPAVRSMVVATVHAIGERQGVVVEGVETTPNRVTITIERTPIEALGFVAELRRITNAWYAGKFGGAPLWGTPAGEGEEWKQR